MQSAAMLESYYDTLQREGTRLAGGLKDLAQRATVYHHLFEHSGRNHVFPLIAAHGAMWARGHFRFGDSLGKLLSWQYALQPELRYLRIEQLAAFGSAFRDINRRVCVATYASYYFTERYGEHPDAGKIVPQELLAALNQCHAARRTGRELSTAEKRSIYEAFFFNEQLEVVGPSIQSATREFGWPVMRFFALRPHVRFAYFPSRTALRFRNFSNRSERIENGLRAFDLAAEAGWDVVVKSLRDYAILPDAFFASPARHFAAIREFTLAGA